MQKLTKGLETKYKLATFLAIFTIAFEVIMEVLIPKIMANVIDVGIQNKDVDYVVKVGLLMIASSMASLFFGVIAARFASVASLGFGRNLRRNLFAKVQDFFRLQTSTIFRRVRWLQGLRQMSRIRKTHIR